jgi:hypothetical protein
MDSGDRQAARDLLVAGQVERAAIRNSRYPTYDELLLQAARNWRYRPALKDGTPVKYSRTIFIVLQK